MRNLVRAALLGAAGAAAALALAAGPASASAIGAWSIHDHGQGCWGGGPLNSDGSLGGGGACSLVVPGVGHEIASISPDSYTLNGDSATLCLTVNVRSGPPIISGSFCVPVPVTGGAPAPIPQLSSDTYGKVTLAG
jgi:hypothetical protein